ncbi:MAG: DUF1365 domain-containing protein [Salinarimonas sp.]|nr:DUF1365 domain-containing protein [Salinarimonas sp.]
MNPAPAAFYRGAIMHARLRPRFHRFRYEAFLMHVDLDGLDETASRMRFFSRNRFNLMSLHEADHLPGEPGETLADRARAAFATRGIPLPPQARITLLALPRILGYAFNPISIYHARDGQGRSLGVLYEVRNTFGERHLYAAAAGPEGRLARHGARKAFHVSPFLPMDLDYRFDFLPPGARTRLRILEHDAEGLILTAAFAGKRLQACDANLLRLFFRLPLMSLKVILGIHVEAFRLWLKGIPVHGHPGNPRGEAAQGDARCDTPLTSPIPEANS